MYRVLKGLKGLVFFLDDSRITGPTKNLTVFCNKLSNMVFGSNERNVYSSNPPLNIWGMLLIAMVSEALTARSSYMYVGGKGGHKINLNFVHFGVDKLFPSVFPNDN